MYTKKRYNWTLIYFVTHLLHQGHKWCRIDPEMANLEDFWVCWKCPKIWPPQKKCGKIKATPFLNSFKVSDSDSEVRILIKILVLKLSNLMTLFVCSCTVTEDSTPLGYQYTFHLHRSFILRLWLFMILLPFVSMLRITWSCLVTHGRHMLELSSLFSIPPLQAATEEACYRTSPSLSM